MQLYFLLVGPLIKLWLSAPVGTLIVIIIEFSIAKVIRILNFNHILVLGASSKGLKGLVKFYIVYFTILELVDVI